MRILRAYWRIRHRRYNRNPTWTSANGSPFLDLLLKLQSVDECIKHYLRLLRDVFDTMALRKGIIPKGDRTARFDSQKFEDLMRSIVKLKTSDENALMEDSRTNRVRVFVVATQALNPDGPPTLFRSYRSRDHAQTKCTIWEAARATTAAPIWFKPIKIDIPASGVTFGDGGFRQTNPTELALGEARTVWPVAQKVCLVSIGAGLVPTAAASAFLNPHPAVGLYRRLSGKIKGTTVHRTSVMVNNIEEAILQTSRSTEVKHRQILRMSTSGDPEDRFPYYRFNLEWVGSSLEDWEDSQQLSSATTAYLKGQQNSTVVSACVQDLVNPPPIECKRSTDIG
jgi:predicted acylesterase/phospholipase RssA